MEFGYTPEHEELIRTLRGFARKELAPRSPQWDKTGRFDWDIWRQMGALGLFGFRVPAASPLRSARPSLRHPRRKIGSRSCASATRPAK